MLSFTSDWINTAVSAKKSGACFGPYSETFGAFPNDVNQKCGTLPYQAMKAMLEEEEGPAPIQDVTTKASIAFLPSKEAFVSYSGPLSIASIVAAAQTARLVMI